MYMFSKDEAEWVDKVNVPCLSDSNNLFNFQPPWYGMFLQEMNVQLIGLCCGNMPAYTRTMAETLGRSPPASVYSPDMSQHRSELHKYQFNKYTEA